MQELIGTVVKGRVCGIKNYGIFVDLGEGCFGLIHISEVSEKYVKNIKDYVRLNQIIEAKIIDYNESNKQYKLTIKNMNYDFKNKDVSFFKNKDNGFISLNSKLTVWIREKLNEYHYKKNIMH